MPLPKLPKLGGFPKPPRISEIIKKANPVREVIDDARELIKTGREEISEVASSLRVEEQKEGASERKSTSTIQEPENPEQEDIATACVPCGVGHFAGAAKLLSEAVRFRGDGITSNQVLDDIAGAIGELNTMERVDLTPEKLQSTLGWERPIADEALRESRKLRHRLEGISSMEEVEQAAADSERFYKKLFRDWFQQRFAHLGPEKAQRIADKVGQLSPEDKDRVLKRAEELIEGA